MVMEVKDKGKMDRSEQSIDLAKDYKSWSPLEADYQFFTPALLNWKTPLDRDFVADFVSAYGVSGPDMPMKFVSRFPLFSMKDSVKEFSTSSGARKEDLAKVIYICPKTIWEKFSSFLESVAFFSKDSQFSARAVRQPDLIIPDFGSIAEGIVGSKTITVAAYGLYASAYCNIFRQSYGDNSLPKAVQVDPAEIVVKDSIMFLQGLI